MRDVATYDPTNHPLLSPTAKTLTPEQLEAYADRAEYVLKVADADFLPGSEEAKRLTLAVVLQINHTLGRESRGGSGGEVVSESKGDQSVKYATPKDGVTDPVDAEAKAIVDDVLSGAAPAHAPRTSTSTPNVFTW